jgi:hypothetical protein
MNKDAVNKDMPTIDLDPLKDFAKANFLATIEKVRG